MILLKAVFVLEVGGAKDAQAARTGHLAREGVSPMKHNSSLGGGSQGRFHRYTTLCTAKCR